MHHTSNKVVIGEHNTPSFNFGINFSPSCVNICGSPVIQPHGTPANFFQIQAGHQELFQFSKYLNLFAVPISLPIASPLKARPTSSLPKFLVSFSVSGLFTFRVTRLQIVDWLVG